MKPTIWQTKNRGNLKMTTARDLAIRCSDWLRLPRLVGAGPDAGLTTVLFHHFRFGDETWALARERLRCQLGQLVEMFDPVKLDDVQRLLHKRNSSVRRPLLVTIDDAKRENLEVADLFCAAGIPVVHFVCAGWTARSDAARDAEGLKLRLAARLHYYEGDPKNLTLGGETFTLDRTGNARLIDAMIATEAREDLERLDDLDCVLHRAASADSVCNWTELRDLKAQGATIGCHSVSHPQIAKQTPLRQRFEIEAAHRYISARLGPCRHFAYPYGTSESYDEGTRALVAGGSFDTAFVTRPAVARPGADVYELPRLTLPDEVMNNAVFRARVRGGGIPLNRLKEFIL